MKKILRLVIADDEPYIRTNLKALFPWRELGYEISASFSNGLDALNYLETIGADVLLTDIQMPVMDGLSLLKQLHKHQIPVRTVILSAYTEFEYAKQGIQYGAVDYIVKPISYEEITDVFTSLHRAICGPGAQETPDTLTRIICYMEDHLADATLEGAASQIHLSTDYLSRLFRKKTGTSFSEYLLNTRMKEAGALMKQIHLSIGEIASRLGYKNPKNFTRAFRNYYGMAPTEYRRQTDEEDNL